MLPFEIVLVTYPILPLDLIWLKSKQLILSSAIARSVSTIAIGSLRSSEIYAGVQFNLLCLVGTVDLEYYCPSIRLAPLVTEERKRKLMQRTEKLTQLSASYCPITSIQALALCFALLASDQTNYGSTRLPSSDGTKDMHCLQCRLAL